MAILMSNREEEINFAVGIIQKFCIETDICLVPKEKNGIHYVAIHDNKTEKDYVLLKSKNKEI